MKIYCFCVDERFSKKPLAVPKLRRRVRLGFLLWAAAALVVRPWHRAGSPDAARNPSSSFGGFPPRLFSPSTTTNRNLSVHHFLFFVFCQALSHVKEFRECMLSDEAGVSLYAAGKANLAEPDPTPADEILSFPGFKKRKKRKKGEGDEGVEETTVVPVCECPKSFALQLPQPPLLPLSFPIPNRSFSPWARKPRTHRITPKNVLRMRTTPTSGCSIHGHAR